MRRTGTSSGGLGSGRRLRRRSNGCWIRPPPSQPSTRRSTKTCGRHWCPATRTASITARNQGRYWFCPSFTPHETRPSGRAGLNNPHFSSKRIVYLIRSPRGRLLRSRTLAVLRRICSCRIHDQSLYACLLLPWLGLRDVFAALFRAAPRRTAQRSGRGKGREPVQPRQPCILQTSRKRKRRTSRR
jgi:hypothetical protein